MIIKQKITGFVQQITPRRKFDEKARSYTSEPDLGKDGLPRFTLLVAVPGERESLKITASQADLGVDPEALQGQIVSLTYTAKVSVAWANADSIEILGGQA